MKITTHLQKRAKEKMSVQKKATLVFVPFPIPSHLAAAVKAAKLLSGRDDRLSVTILIMNFPLTSATISSYIKNDSTVNFLQLPIRMPDSPPEIRSPERFALQLVESQKDLVRDAVVELMESSKLAGIVVDFFCATMIDLAKDLGAPGYVFFTSGATFLGLMFHLQSLRDDDNLDPSEYEESDGVVSFSAFVNPVPARVWPSPVFDNGNGFLDIAKKFREAKGIVVNTFLEFEPHAIGSLSGDGKIPPVYPVGPIIQDEREEESEEREEKRRGIIGWLDQQPDNSVVYLCFGTVGSFGEVQVKEIAVGLEKSGVRFLWSLRKPPPKGVHAFPGEFENPDEVLPEGFLDRMEGVGKVIGWAPQMAVLAHSAVGGFVSHCGWNSILESVWCGVPMAVWPLAAEQQLNAFELVKELEIAVEIKMDYRKNSDVIVGAEKIEEAIRVLMDRDNGIRVKVNELKEHSRKVLMEGGSSFNFFGSLIDDIIDGIS